MQSFNGLRVVGAYRGLRMSGAKRLSRSDVLVDHVQVRPIGIDDWSDVRYVHAAAFRMLAGLNDSPRTINAFNSMVGQPDYVDRMREAHLVGAWLDGELVGTSGWRPADDRGATARITGLFVRPLFTTLGVGSLLLARAEAAAREAGFRRFTVSATGATVGFYTQHDYDITSYGAHAIDGVRELKLVFLRKSDAVLSVASADVASSARVGGMVPSTGVDAAEAGLVFGEVPRPAGLSAGRRRVSARSMVAAPSVPGRIRVP